MRTLCNLLHIGLCPCFTGMEGKGGVNDWGSQWQKCSYTSGNYDLRICIWILHSRDIHTKQNKPGMDRRTGAKGNDAWRNSVPGTKVGLISDQSGTYNYVFTMWMKQGPTKTWAASTMLFWTKCYTLLKNMQCHSFYLFSYFNTKSQPIA